MGFYLAEGCKERPDVIHYGKEWHFAHLQVLAVGSVRWIQMSAHLPGGWQETDGRYVQEVPEDKGVPVGQEEVQEELVVSARWGIMPYHTSDPRVPPMREAVFLLEGYVASTQLQPLPSGLWDLGALEGKHFWS